MKKMYLLLAAFLTAGLATAKSTAAASSSSNASADDYSWNAHAYVGHSWTAKAGITNPSAAQFNAVASTDTDDSKLGKGAFVGLAVNKALWSWLSAGVSMELHQPYRYDLYHSTAGTAATSAGSGYEVLDATGFRRQFNLNHYSAMFNVGLSLPEDWSMSLGCLNVSPTLGGGVGVGVNEVRNFQAVGTTTASSTAYGITTTMAMPNSKADVAYQANGGLQFASEDSNVCFGVSYRYYYGGKFETATSYAFNDQTNAGGQGTGLAAWTGKLKAHQVMLCVGLEF